MVLIITSPNSPQFSSPQCKFSKAKGLVIAVSLLFVASLVGCSGGGGGDDFFGPAKVDFRVTPKSIFVGDRVVARAQLKEVNEDGIVLIYRFPTVLSYVNNSARLVLNDDDEVALTPVLNQAVEKDQAVYLVFVLPASAFDDEERGEVTLQLLAIASKESAKIELDPNIRDLEKADNQQFNIQDPVFGTDIVEIIQIKKS